MANDKNDERFVFNCLSRYTEGGKETTCRLSPEVMRVLGIEFLPQQVQSVVPATTPGETATMGEITVPVSSVE